MDQRISTSSTHLTPLLATVMEPTVVTEVLSSVSGRTPVMLTGS
jgi:hypothetical protein